MLIAEDLLLLVTDDTTGRLFAPAEQVDIGLAGANLLELALMDRVGLSGPGDEARPGRVVVRDPSAPGDPVLDAALGIVTAHQGKKPARVLEPLSKHLRRTLYERLAESGVVEAEEGRVLGVFPTHRWPSHDARHAAEVRALVTRALVDGATPDRRSAALIALLHALRCEHKVVDPRRHDISKRKLRARSEEIAQGSWASDAVRSEIDEMTAAIVVAVLAVVVLSGA